MQCIVQNSVCLDSIFENMVSLSPCTCIVKKIQLEVTAIYSAFVRKIQFVWTIFLKIWLAMQPEQI